MTLDRAQSTSSTLALALALVLLSPLAHAQKRKPNPKPIKPAVTAPPPSAPPAGASASGGETPEDATKTEAKAHFDRGLELLAEEAYDAAYAEFSRSRKLFPTKAATKNAAICLRRLKRYEEALDAFEALQAFSNLTEHDRAFAEREIAQVRAFVGTIEARGGEGGAVVTIDGRERGALPLVAPLRVSVGSHVVRVFKSGYAPFESRIEIVGGQNVVVAVRLDALAQSGRLAVTEQAGKSAAVVIDNVVVGQTPWEGSVFVGEHTIVLRGEGDLATQPAVARVRLNETTPLALVLEQLASTFRVEPTPVNALVVVDGVPVGRGIWEGRLRSGAHKLEVVEEGFIPRLQPVELASEARAVLKIDLERDMSSPLWRVGVPSRFFVDARVGGVIGPTLAGDVSSIGGGSAGLVLGGAGRASVGYELGIGLGFSVDAGYAWMRQPVTARATALSPLPVGSSPAEIGTTDDSLTARGPALGASVLYHRGTNVRWTARVGGGLWLATVSDRRSGTFTTTINARPDGTTGTPTPYALDGIEQNADGRYIYVAPELRAGLPLGKNAEIAFGVEAFVALAVSQPTWQPLSTRVVTGTCRVNATPDCVTDGLAVFDESKLTGKAFLLILPGLSLRYDL